MMRQPNQVLVIPFKKIENSVLYGVFRRSDDNYWQFIAGGVDGSETPAEAASREAFEEAGIPINSKLVTLDTICSMPANIFRDWQKWPKGTFVVKEYSFGIEFNGPKFTISDEHTDFKWRSYEEAITLLKWDSNRTALWELSQRLK